MADRLRAYDLTELFRPRLAKVLDDNGLPTGEWRQTDEVEKYGEARVLLAEAELVDNAASIDLTDVDLVVFYAGPLETEVVCGTLEVAQASGVREVRFVP